MRYVSDVAAFCVCMICGTVLACMGRDGWAILPFVVAIAIGAQSRGE